MVANPYTKKRMEGRHWQWEVKGSGADGQGAQRVIQRTSLC